MHVCVTTCALVCNGGSPVSCLQPRVHSQQSVCGEYDGKVHASCLQAHPAEALENQNSVIIMASFVCAHLSVCLIVVNVPHCVVCVASVCTVFFFLLVSVV